MNYFNLWIEYTDGLRAVMLRNLKNDIEAGYNPQGAACVAQAAAIREHDNNIAEALALFRTLPDAAINHYCKFDLMRRGAIA